MHRERGREGWKIRSSMQSTLTGMNWIDLTPMQYVMMSKDDAIVYI
jgi:hypothetical protein